MQDKINKLPKWAQEHIKDLNRQRDVAIKALNEYCDSQTDSEFSIQELECTGEEGGPSFKRRYIQTRKIEVDYGGVGLSVSIADQEIRLSWWASGVGLRDVAFIPISYQYARITAKENMR